jgi:DNA invertase Pin-like site-specific DNA recombinase
MNSSPRVALYARVSTTQGQDVGLQLDELRSSATQRGWTVAGEYVDEGISGARARRPALDKLLEDAQAGKFTLVAIWKLDRLARSVTHLLQMTESFNQWGVGLVSLRDAHIDTTTPTGRFTLQILGAVAELERSLIRERVIAGVERAKASGKHCGRPRKETSEKTLDAARALLDQGWSWRATAEAVGVQKDTLRRRLREQNATPQTAVEQPP